MEGTIHEDTRMVYHLHWGEKMKQVALLVNAENVRNNDSSIMNELM